MESLTGAMEGLALAHARQEWASGEWAHTLVGAFDSVSREQSVGAGVIPSVLRQLFFMRGLVGDDDEMRYTIWAPHKYAYVMRLHGVGGWLVDVHVNMWGGAEADVTRLLEMCGRGAIRPSRVALAPTPLAEEVIEVPHAIVDIYDLANTPVTSFRQAGARLDHEDGTAASKGPSGGWPGPSWDQPET